MSSTHPPRGQPDMPTHWYTADTHFGHENVIRLSGRPFRSASYMDAALIENLWSKVGPEDVLWIVGDFAFGERAEDLDWLEGLFGQLPGAQKHLVLGNHDGEATRLLPWDSVGQLVEVADPAADPALPAVLCHYPMMTWHRARKGALHLFGHVHDKWVGARGAVNVGVDQWNFHPVRIEDVARRAAKLPPNRHWGNVEHGKEVV